MPVLHLVEGYGSNSANKGKVNTFSSAGLFGPGHHEFPRRLFYLASGAEWLFPEEMDLRWRQVKKY